MRRHLILLTGLLLLIGINLNVWRYERAIGHGEPVLLRLTPVDPRSLMQGDYMRLSYDLGRRLGSKRDAAPLVIRLDKQRVAHWVTEGRPETFARDERLLRVRLQQGQWRVGPDAYFFEEGQGARFATARYGEFRLLPDGTALLTGLRDDAFQPIGPIRAAW